MKNLLTGTSDAAKDFRENIRQYNAAMAFASLGFDQGGGHVNMGAGTYVYRIHGNIYHNISDALPNPNEVAKFGQLYYLDAGIYAFRIV